MRQIRTAADAFEDAALCYEAALDWEWWPFQRDCMIGLAGEYIKFGLDMLRRALETATKKAVPAATGTARK